MPALQGFTFLTLLGQADPKHLFSMAGGRGVVASAHTVIRTSDARYAVGAVDLQYWPVVVFDLEAGLAR